MDEVWKLQVRALAIWKREGSPEGLPNQFNPMAEEKLAHVSSRTTDPVGMIPSQYAVSMKQTVKIKLGNTKQKTAPCNLPLCGRFYAGRGRRVPTDHRSHSPRSADRSTPYGWHEDR